MKKFFITLTILFSFFIISYDVKAITATIKDNEGLNVRKGPGTNYGIVTTLSNNTKVTLVSEKVISGKGCDSTKNSGWLQINYGGSTDRYICNETVVISSTTQSSNGTYYTSKTWDVRIIEDYANVRKSASSNSSVIERIYLGTKVNILSSSGDYYKISYYDGKTGYVLKKLCKSYNEITKEDKEYYKVLEEKKFPKSYWPFLSYLHNKYPNWEFIADDTGRDFNKVVNDQTGKNYIQTTLDSYRTSNTVRENPNWYTASSSVVAVYLDPRNYLNESSIFAFETLKYNETYQTSDVLKSIFSGSYLNDDTYISYFMDAGKDNSISPIHLASRSKQEGATNSNYAAISGVATSKSNLKYDGKDLDGFYNYYNIGSYEDNKTDSAVTRGLAVAAGYVDKYDGTPWDTREKAIKFGAKFIASEYVNRNQDTMYYQKFNVSKNTSSPNTHQYMTNIVAPASESLSTFTSYNDIKILDKKITFYIPVYNNLPEEFTTLPLIGDTNNELSDIKIDDTSLVGFDKDVIEYVHYVTYDKTEINIDATKVSDKSSIIGTGKITLKDNETDVKIIVTSQTGEEKTYTITIIKQEKPKEEVEVKEPTVDEILNNIDIKFSDDYISGISSNTTATTLINMIKEKNPNAIIKITNKDNKEKTNTILATNDIIEITSNNEKKSYTISIKGDNNGDGQISAIDMLRIQKHLLKYTKLTNAELSACDTNYDGKVNSTDMLRIQKHLLKYITLK